jgi:transcriptional regulator with XRE-family HTH domain
LDRDDVKFLLRFLRAYTGLDQVELAQKAGLVASSIWRYEQGKMTPQPATLQRLVAVAGWGWEFVQEKLLPRLRALRLMIEAKAGGAEEGFERAAQALAARFQEEARRLFAELNAPEERTTSRLQGIPAAADREEAEYLWSCLAPRTPRERDFLLDECPRLRSWVVVEHLGTLAGEAGADSARALELARLAVQVAERVPGEPTWQARVHGYAQANLGRVLLRLGDGGAAVEALALGESLWAAGEGAPNFLDDEGLRWGASFGGGECLRATEDCQRPPTGGEQQG